MTFLQKRPSFVLIFLICVSVNNIDIVDGISGGKKHLGGPVKDIAPSAQTSDDSSRVT